MELTSSSSKHDICPMVSWFIIPTFYVNVSHLLGHNKSPDNQDPDYLTYKIF